MSKFIDTKRQIKDLYNPNNDFRVDVPISFAEYALLGMVEDLERQNSVLVSTISRLEGRIKTLENKVELLIVSNYGV